MEPGIQFEFLDASELAHDASWWTIYDGSFPSQEREPRSVILRAVEAGAGMAFRVRAGEVAVGLATTHLLTSPPAVFLVYLAVTSRRRAEGLGGRLFEFAWSASAARLRERGLDPLGLIWEVDPPANSDPVAVRRIAFFEKHGGILLDRPYWQPPVNFTEPVSMRLMFRPAQAPMPESSTFDAIVRGIYREKYGVVNRIPTKTLDRLLTQAAIARI